MFKFTKFYQLVALIIALTLLVATPVFAQSETEPLADPDPVQTEEQSTFFGSKIVQMIADFFADLINPPQEELPVEEPPDGEPPVGEEPPAGELPEGEEPVEEPEPTIVPEEFVASLHEDENMGYGEIVKILDLANNAAAICADTGEFCDVTYETLLAEYDANPSMGALFAKYGKPENLGVGQLKNDPPGQAKEKSNYGQAKGKDKGG